MSPFLDDFGYAPGVIKRLESFPAVEARALGAWLRENPVGTNLALRLLELLADLAKKEGRAATDFFSELPQGAELQAKERGRRWCEGLERRLHPHLRAHAEAFAAHVRRLELPQGVALAPPQGFEGKSFELRISFADLSELRERMRELESSLENPEWSRLWEF